MKIPRMKSIVSHINNPMKKKREKKAKLQKFH